MDFVSLLFYITALFAITIAAIALVKDRKAPARRTFCIAILLLAAQNALAGAVYSSTSSTQAEVWRSWWLVPQALSPGAWLLFILKYSRGNFQRSVQKWLPFIVAIIGLPIISITLLSENIWLPSVGASPEREFEIGLGGFVLYLCIVLCAALILIQAERTFRAAVGTMRWQIKYVILGVSALFTAKLYTSSQVLLFKTHSFYFDIINCVALLIACGLFLNGLFRTGLVRIELYPSEQVLQFSVAGVLIGAYLVLIGVFSKIFEGWQGPEAFAVKAFFLLSSLAVAGILFLSERSRDKLRRWVSQHFRRPFYDYRGVWLSLTEKTATILDSDTLCRTVAEWISERLHVLSASIWLVDLETQSIRLAASTGISAGPQKSFDGDFSGLISALQHEKGPFDIDRRPEPWVDQLKPCFPDHFAGAGNRVCVPLTAAGRLIGFGTLGDRVNYIPLETQEFELLKCVGDQVGSSLLSLELSNRLIQAKEMEAFQTISAFFVHDLKNTASTLNLTLQNLPKHFDNPEFRKDALKAIGKSVNHIHELISRLTLFRQKLELTCSAVDLNSLVTSTLQGIKPRGVTVVSKLSDLEPVRGDADQLQKVLTNLVLNALEAVGQDGHIEVSTSRENGRAVLSVSDNGCGMSPEFIAGSLFRPFKTTKKGGIGIGMFQIKTIIDAHGGRIDVMSQPSQGTTFKVSLPCVDPAQINLKSNAKEALQTL